MLVVVVVVAAGVGGGGGVRMMIRGECWNLKRGLFESWCQE